MTTDKNGGRAPSSPKECPRCGMAQMNPEEVLNALSRRDNKTYICRQCGVDEAMHDYKLARAKATESRWLRGGG